MIGKVPKAGRGFRGLVSYLLNGAKADKDKTPRVTWAETRNLITDDPDQAPAIMRMTARKSARVKSPVYHLMISWHKNEGPTEDLTREVADTTCSDMGLDEYQRFYIAHHDTEHRHVHIVVNRVHPETGKAWRNSHDYHVIEESLKRQSEAHGLEFIPGRHNSPELFKDRPKRARDASLRKARREGRESPRPGWTTARIVGEREQLNPIFEAARRWRDLEARLAQQKRTLGKKGQGS